MGNTPLERGETLTLFYTLGSPIAIWSLRYRDFGVPIRVPSPGLARLHRGLNGAYRRAVKADRGVNAGGLLSAWNPASHLGYWTDNDVTKPIAGALARTWRTVNPSSKAGGLGRHSDRNV